VGDFCLGGADPVDTNDDGVGDACSWDAAAGADPTRISYVYSGIGTWIGPQAVTVRSTGADPVTFGAAAILGFDRANFEIVSDSCSQAQLPNGATCQVSLRFRAGSYDRFARTRTHSYGARLSLPSNANAGALEVWLVGEHFSSQLPPLMKGPAASGFEGRDLFPDGD
jgi:hypothetical protein